MKKLFNRLFCKAKYHYYTNSDKTKFVLEYGHRPFSKTEKFDLENIKNKLKWFYAYVYAYEGKRKILIDDLRDSFDVFNKATREDLLSQASYLYKNRYKKMGRVRNIKKNEN